MTHPPRAGLPSPRATWAFFIDLDGTLLEFADTPSQVVTDRQFAHLIDGLSHTGAFALVSGRSIRDMDGLIGVAPLPMAGQHGLERRDAAGRIWRAPHGAALDRTIRIEMMSAAARHDGLLLEDKGLSLALHYRRAPRWAEYAQRLVEGLAERSAGSLECLRGNGVAELKLAGADKGSALAAFMHEPPFRGRLPVALGDDVTDECAFAAANRLGGISIKVGAAPSCARYRLANVAEARAWLRQTLDNP